MMHLEIPFTVFREGMERTYEGMPPQESRRKTSA